MGASAVSGELRASAHQSIASSIEPVMLTVACATPPKLHIPAGQNHRLHDRHALVHRRPQGDERRTYISTQSRLAGLTRARFSASPWTWTSRCCASSRAKKAGLTGGYPISVTRERRATAVGSTATDTTAAVAAAVATAVTTDIRPGSSHQLQARERRRRRPAPPLDRNSRDGAR